MAAFMMLGARLAERENERERALGIFFNHQVRDCIIEVGERQEQMREIERLRALNLAQNRALHKQIKEDNFEGKLARYSLAVQIMSDLEDDQTNKAYKRAPGTDRHTQRVGRKPEMVAVS